MRSLRFGIAVSGLTIVFFIAFFCIGKGQSVVGVPLTKFYSVEPVFAATQDNQGIIYLTGDTRLQTFDGVDFETVSEKFIGLYDIERDTQGTIYLSGPDQFLMSYVDAIGQIQFKSLLTLLKESVKLGDMKLFATRERIFAVSASALLEYDPVKKKLNAYPGSYAPGFVKDNRLYLIQGAHRQLVVFQDGKFLPAPHLGSSSINNVTSALAMTFTGRERVLSLSSDWVAYSANGNDLRALKPEVFSTSGITSSVSINKKYHVVTSESSGAMLIDSIGNLLYRYSMATGLPQNWVQDGYVDKQSNLWLMQNSSKNSLTKTEPGLDIKTWHKPISVSWEFVKFNERIYLACFDNLYEINPSTNLMRPMLKGTHPIRALVNFSTSEGEHLLAAVRPEQQIIEFTVNGDTRKIYQGKRIIHIRQSKTNPNRLYVCDDGEFSYLIYDHGNWTHHPLKIDFDDCAYCMEDSDGSVWVCNRPKNKIIRVYFEGNEDVVSVKNLIRYTASNGLPEVFIYPISLGRKEVVFLSDEGLLYFNTSSQKFERWSNKLGKKYQRWFDADLANVFENPYDGSIYIQRNKNRNFDIAQLKPLPGGDTVIIEQPFKRITGELRRVDAFAFLAEEDGTLWWSSDEVVMNYNPNNNIKNYNAPFSTLIRKVTLNDSVLYGGYFQEEKLKSLKPQWSYDKNSLTIRYAAPFYDGEDRTEYSYKLEGLDDQWSSWQTNTQREYKNLFEGDYTFKVKAKNIYGVESSVASISFRVLPPWYRSWLAYGIYSLLFIGFIVGLVQWRTKTLRKKKQELEQIVQNKTKELLQINHELIAANEHLQKTQRQLVESEKMASLGQLTAGIAHEINNPINFISGGVEAISSVTNEFLNSKERSPEMLEATIRDIQELMSSIKNGVNRTAGIISSLRSFSSPSESTTVEMNITECIENALVLLQRKAVDHRISIERNYQHHNKAVGNPSQITQVILNLIDNSIYAMDKVAEPRVITITTYEQGEELVLKVKDNGEGIPEQSQPHVFEPFFTTKEVGAGVGLGLSISYSIIEKHKGKITFTSKPEEGTEFTIKIPLT